MKVREGASEQASERCRCVNFAAHLPPQNGLFVRNFKFFLEVFFVGEMGSFLHCNPTAHNTKKGGTRSYHSSALPREDGSLFINFLGLRRPDWFRR